MKYVDTEVVFREVPDEVTLAINISNCPVCCPGCHSSYLAQDIGEPLTKEALQSLIDSNKGISCVSFMGGDAEPEKVKEYALWIKENWSGMKVCWYSGRSLENARPYLDALDYLKVGPFIEEFGPLDWETTNQRFYRITKDSNGKASTEDITAVFRKKIL